MSQRRTGGLVVPPRIARRIRKLYHQTMHRKVDYINMHGWITRQWLYILFRLRNGLL